MSSLENEIRQIIVERYGTLAEFSRHSKIAYTTIDSMLKRGIKNANVLNVIKICDALNISVDKLRHGLIEPAKVEEVSENDFFKEVKSLLNDDLSEQQKIQIISFLKFVNNNDDK
jgi:hypothetical protein